MAKTAIYHKFVVADFTDIDEVGRAGFTNTQAGNFNVHCISVGWWSEEYNRNVKEVAEICMEKGWRFTITLLEMTGVRDNNPLKKAMKDQDLI